MTRLHIRHLKLPRTVECDDCTGLRADATLERAREHVKRTGHTVQITVRHVTVYRPAADPATPVPRAESRVERQRPTGNRRASTSQQFDREDTEEI